MIIRYLGPWREASPSPQPLEAMNQTKLLGLSSKPAKNPQYL